MGPTPVWLVTRVVSALLGIAGAYPALAAVARAGAAGPPGAGGSPVAHVPPVAGETLAAQAAVSVVVLGMYLLAAGRAGSPG
jgi:hypothetical protein